MSTRLAIPSVAGASVTTVVKGSLSSPSVAVGQALPLPWADVPAPFSEALVELGHRSPEVVVLTADLMHWTDTLAFAEAFPDRFWNVGMAEQNLVGVGAGMARAGAFPVIVTYGVFAARRAYDQVAMSLCTGGVRALLVGFLPGISSQFRATHQALDDVALMRALPGMTVLDPADATELTAMVLGAPERPGPSYVRASRGLVPRVFTGVPEMTCARRVREGPDAVLVSSGIGTRWALEAAALLSSRSVEAEVQHHPMLKPFDDDAVADLAQRHRVLHCVENHSTVGGLAAAVSCAVAARGLGVRVVAHGIPDRWAEYGRMDFNRGMLGLDAASIAAAVEREIK